MSQPSTPFDGTTEDPFLSSSDQEQLSQADFHELFGPNASDEATFSSNNNEVFDRIEYAYEDVSLVPVESSSSSVVSTPNLSGYSFSHHSPTYPTPEPEKTHPYPYEIQQAYKAYAPQQALNHRPVPIRSQTNNVYLHSVQLSQPGHRRRSLSHGDMDRVVPAANIQNPTFFRLQAPRARTTIPEEHRRRGLCSYGGGSPGQISSPRGGSMKPTSMPYSLQSMPLVGGMLPTPIGTPLNGVKDTICDTKTTQQDTDMDKTHPPLSSFPEGLVFRQMSRPEELVRSRQIIEIGALAVTNHAKIDPMLESRSSTSNHERVLKKLIDIEEHLEKDGGVEALRSCRMIREVLTGKAECRDETNFMDGVLNDDVEESSGVNAGAYSDVFHGRNNNEIMAMLMKQHGVGDDKAE